MPKPLRIGRVPKGNESSKPTIGVFRGKLALSFREKLNLPKDVTFLGIFKVELLVFIDLVVPAPKRLFKISLKTCEGPRVWKLIPCRRLQVTSFIFRCFLELYHILQIKNKHIYGYKLTQFLPPKPDQLEHLGYVPGSCKKIKITIDVGRQSTRQPFSPGSWRRPWRGTVWIHGVTFLAAHVRLVMCFQEITTRHDAPQGRCGFKRKLFENGSFVLDGKVLYVEFFQPSCRCVLSSNKVSENLRIPWGYERKNWKEKHPITKPRHSLA